ncbi:hypothetical protein AB670_02640 [Chryseobacterium sp. MOF25P]|uniref:DUF4280 domain-containing protein n=1 Tax=unclassified Chryseobacterium TaxID=2593645 RepID=UPI000805D46C|nr:MULTISPECIES: DUF4280 domain-containing protein [unclassified Chryseobacterium]OBW41050.1 hypothetical protein AB670_02640 [Chryseobacterium sp. MOF25P]OBW43789.1 hypothetical protein AB671_04127 [Chryseobacterium sp. BGARF1]
MSEKHLVCHGATCQCKFGTTPDKLTVKTQSKRYINENGRKKLMATHVDIGPTFEKNTFGFCKKMNNNPCQVIVTQWSGFYEKIMLEDNQGKALLEDSKATCPIGGPDCIEIINHGQTAEASAQNMKNADKEVLVEMIPFVDFLDEESQIHLNVLS